MSQTLSHVLNSLIANSQSIYKCRNWRIPQQPNRHLLIQTQQCKHQSHDWNIFKVTIKTPEQRQWRRFGVFIVSFEPFSYIVLVIPLLALNNLILAGKVPTFNALYPAGNFMFKVNKRNTRTRCEICSKLAIKIPERYQCFYS